MPAALGLPPAFTVQDLLTDRSYAWHTGGNYILLGPGQSHIMHVK